jgi:diguanylate cyclase (GGDEF)-like protein
MRLSPGAAAHWAGFCLATALAMLMFLDAVREPLGTAAVVMRNALVVLGIVLLRRGLLAFFRQPLRDLEQWGVYFAYLAAMAPLGTAQEGLQGRAIVLSIALAWPLLRGGMELLRGARAEFGRLVAWIVTVPMLGMGGLMVLRAGLAALNPVSGATTVTATGTFNAMLLLSLVVLCTLFHFGLMTLVILRLVGRLRHLSSHDALTGLLNRRAFDERLAQEVAASRRTGLPLGLLMIDVDHFKLINDKHGHAGGDQALCAVAERLARAARSNDVVARLGGEEFAALLPATDAAGIRQAAERLRQAVSAQPLVLAGGQQTISVSVGASMRLVEETAGDPLQRRADQALYRAKAEGRNCVVVDALAGVAPAVA